MAAHVEPAWKASLRDSRFVPGPIASGYLAAFVDFAGLGMILPLLPFFVREHHGSDEWLGAILSAQYFGVIIGSVLFGWLSDKFGRYEGVLASLTGDTVMFLVSGFAGSNFALFCIRFLAGSSTPLSASVSLLVSSTDNAQRPKAMANLSASLITGFLVGSIAAGALQGLGFQAVCTASSLVALVATTLVFLSRLAYGDQMAGLKPSMSRRDLVAHADTPTEGDVLDKVGEEAVTADVEAGAEPVKDETVAEGEHAADADGVDATTGSAVDTAAPTEDSAGEVSEVPDTGVESAAEDGTGVVAAETDRPATESGVSEEVPDTEGATRAADAETDVDKADVGVDEGLVVVDLSSEAPAGEVASAAVPVTDTDAAEDAGSVADAPTLTVREALKSNYVWPILLTSFNSGFSFSFNVTLAPLISINRYQYNELGVSMLYLGVVGTLLLVNLFVYQHLLKWPGIYGITPVSLGFLVVVLLLAPLLVQVRGLFEFVVIATAMSNSVLRPTVNVLASKAAEKLAPDAIGAIMGTTQACMSIGQAICPVIAAVLYTESGELAAYFTFAAVATVNATAMYWYRGLPLNKIAAAEHAESLRAKAAEAKAAKAASS